MADFYKAWEPPQRSELPQSAAGIIRFTRGEGQRAVITIDTGVEVELEHRIKYHSPDGMEFGYLGSGPSDTALNLLALVVSEKEAFRLHQKFKFAMMRDLTYHGGSIPMQAVLEWVRATYEHELTDPLCVAQERVMKEEWNNPDSDPLEAPATIDDLYPPYQVELLKECADPGCKECRTGESDAERFFENVRRLLDRPNDFRAFSDLDMVVVNRHFEAGNSPHTCAKEIATMAAHLTERKQ